MKQPLKPNPGGFRPPVPGERELFICKKCGRRFRASRNILPIPPKCPECGSRDTLRDQTVVY